MDRSPLAPAAFPSLPAIAGVTLRTARAGYKAWDRCDLTYVELDEGTAVAGVTTQSKCPSPEVEWCRDAIPLGAARALVVNAGNANAFTAAAGLEGGDAEAGVAVVEAGEAVEALGDVVHGDLGGVRADADEVGRDRGEGRVVGLLGRRGGRGAERDGRRDDGRDDLGHSVQKGHNTGHLYGLPKVSQ